MKSGKLNEETKLRGESIRVNGLAMDSIMEDQSMDDGREWRDYCVVEETVVSQCMR